MKDEPQLHDRWSLLGGGRQRYEILIDGFQSDGVTGQRFATCVSPNTGRRCVPVRVRTLRMGLRGAQLIERGNGIEGERRRIRPPLAGVATENREARSLVKATRPRGIVDRPITLFETRCAQLRAQGLSRRAIAKETRKTQNQVFHALQNVDDIRAMRALRAAG